MDLAVSLDTLCRIILRAREYEALLPEPEPDDRSGPEDGVHHESPDEDESNPAEAELRAIVADLAEDEQAELIALVLVGGGQYDAGEWADALDAAAEEDDAVGWLMAQPTLSSDLEDGLAAFGLSCDGLGTLG
jgi:hypothetical protein